MRQADVKLQMTLDSAYNDVKAMLQRNRPALDEIIRRLCTPDPSSGPQNGQPFRGNTLLGDDVRNIVNRLAHSADLRARDGELAVFL